MISLTNTLLAIIAISEITRLVLTHKSMSKKAHFKHKLRGTERMVWDLEFKAHKLKEAREETRQELDFMKARIDTFKKQLEQMGKKDEGRGEVEDNLTRAERDLEKLEATVSQFDLEINGASKSAQYPEGVAGVYDQIDSIRELVAMLRSWVKKVK